MKSLLVLALLAIVPRVVVAQMVYRQRVIVQHSPAVVYQAPAVTYTYTAPAVTYVAPSVETQRVESTVSVRHDAYQTGAQRRHAKKAERRLRDAAYWASRS